MISKEEYDAAVSQKEASEVTISAYHTQQEEAFKERMKTNPIFTPEELIFAAHARCSCGHGLAYPKACSMFHYWDCSAILMGTHNKGVKHTDRLPFTFYDIKSENQHSAMGNNTRTPIQA